MERKIIIGDESKTKFLSTLEADVSVSGHTHTHMHTGHKIMLWKYHYLVLVIGKILLF